MRIILSLFSLLLMISLMLGPVLLAQEPELPEVFAQAQGTANLRAAPNAEGDLLGEIANGTEYRVLKQHALVPWLLLEVPEISSGAGWVFAELIQITRGSLSTVPFEESFNPIPSNAGPALAPPSPSPNSETQTDIIPSPTPLGSALETAVPVSNLVTAQILGRSNVRYAPGTDFPAILMVDEGVVLTVLARHSSVPWFQVVVEGSPTGTGWVNEAVIEITGDVSSLPVITAQNFAFPTPSATPNTVVVSDPPVNRANISAETNLASNLGLVLDSYLLSQGLAPRSDREGSIFVLDLFSGEHFTLNGGVAYSGMSINKIPVLVSYFLDRDRPLQNADAELVASMMICSENLSTNRVMTEIGGGDILAGGQKVTGYMQQMGLGNTFVVAPFFTGNPDATPAPVSSIQTGADQQRTQPDLFNQLTVEEIGWLLGSIYECASDETGALVETFPSQINQLECKQMIRVMSGNRIGRLLEAGSQPESTIAHKHGWINNTHGDAGMVFGPEGAYVLSMIYHQRTDWLNYEQSFPVLEEVARLTWNHFNPTYPVAAPKQTDVPEQCNLYGEPVIADMLGGNIAIPTLPAPSIISTEESP